jgi:hypothetical protein
VGIKRRRLERVRYFKAPFRKENYSSHHRRMHGTQWAEYRELKPSAEKSFSTLARSLARRQRCMPCRSSHSPVTCPDRQEYRRCHHWRDDVSPRGHGRDYSSPPSRKLCADSRFVGRCSRCRRRQSVRHHRRQHQAVSVGCTIFGCWTVIPSGFTSDFGDEQGTRHREHWLVL